MTISIIFIRKMQRICSEENPELSINELKERSNIEKKFHYKYLRKFGKILKKESIKSSNSKWFGHALSKSYPDFLVDLKINRATDCRIWNWIYNVWRSWHYYDEDFWRFIQNQPKYKIHFLASDVPEVFWDSKWQEGFKQSEI